VPGWAASEERAATSVRRAGGEATLRALAFTWRGWSAKSRVPEVSLRRRRGLLVAARSSPCGAARGNGEARDERALRVCKDCNNRSFKVVIRRYSCHRPNALRFSRAGAMPVPRQRDARRRAIKCVAADAPRRLLPLVGRETTGESFQCVGCNRCSASCRPPES
jgi:hypothetical protein